MMQNKYLITVVFDTREQKESGAEMLASLRELMEGLGATVEKETAVGQKSFARGDRKFPSGFFGQYDLMASSDFDSKLRKRLRLDARVNRIMIERK